MPVADAYWRFIAQTRRSLVERPDQLEPAITKALAHNGPVLLNVHVNPSELAMPPKVNMEQAKGFGLYLFRQMLDGGMDEAVDTIKTNFLQ